MTDTDRGERPPVQMIQTYTSLEAPAGQERTQQLFLDNLAQASDSDYKLNAS